jgi:hypothetical protein
MISQPELGAAASGPRVQPVRAQAQSADQADQRVARLRFPELTGYVMAIKPDPHVGKADPGRYPDQNERVSASDLVWPTRQGGDFQPVGSQRWSRSEYEESKKSGN